MFVNGGVYYKLYYICKVIIFDGVMILYISIGKCVMKKLMVYMIIDMLKGVINSFIGMVIIVKISGVY